jgi:hypothetical protein
LNKGRDFFQRRRSEDTVDNAHVEAAVII